ncbi:hypothetical protein [Streptomyces sp. NPDC006307]|uniref:ATP-dependent DNA ligase n=1 Tax=Streptomyces sp. NPDC006307 TaxID=3156748 RepID=UPI0033BCDFAD
MVLDGELVVWSQGRLSFEALQHRASAGARTVDQLANTLPAHFIAFDVLQLEGRELLTAPYEHRRALFAPAVHPQHARVSPPCVRATFRLVPGSRPRGLFVRLLAWVVVRPTRLRRCAPVCRCPLRSGWSSRRRSGVAPSPPCVGVVPCCRARLRRRSPPGAAAPLAASARSPRFAPFVARSAFRAGRSMRG